MLTELGYQRRTYEDILNAKIQKAKELFGEDINTEENTPLGKFIRINAFDQSIVEEEAEAIYYSIFPHTASGTSLDRLCPFVGISRNTATFAKFKVTVTGKVGYTIPMGFLVGTESGVNFHSIADAVIDENGTCELDVKCVDRGTIGNVTPAEINIIVESNASVASVIGTANTEKGEDEESDYALRNRFDQAAAGLGSCNEKAIVSALMRVPNVTHASIVVNETDEADAEGRPARSFECYVRGGDYQTIAETIFDKKPAGIKTCGDIAVSVDYGAKEPYIVRFSETSEIRVYIKAELSKTAEFESTGKKDIKNNLSEYINNLGVGNSLILSQLYGQIYKVTGVQEVTSLQLSSTEGATWSTDNITAKQNEVCYCYQVEIDGEVI